jgi:putative phosphoesterase
MRIGVVSDTHGFFDPRLEDLLAGVEMILHAGDVGSRDVLDELGRIAPVRAVRGNVDSLLLGLPPSITATVEGIQIEILHQLWQSQTELEKWAGPASLRASAQRARDTFLENFEPHTRVVIFGHSHAPCAVRLAGRLFFNPGSAGKARFSLPRCCGLLELSPTRVEATIHSLQSYNGSLPERVCLAVGG